MDKRLQDKGSLMAAISQLVEEGAMVIKCDNNLNALSHPVVVDNLVISGAEGVKDQISFVLGWRPIGITETFESGAFNVEDPEFLAVSGFETEGGRLLLYHEPVEEHRGILCLLPIDDEHRPDWQDWVGFKQKNRDFFEELDMQMVDMINYFKKNGKK